MARPRIPAGELGAVSVTALAGGRYRVRGRMRDDAGNLHQSRQRRRRPGAAGCAAHDEWRSCGQRCAHDRRDRRGMAGSSAYTCRCRQLVPLHARVVRHDRPPHPETRLRSDHPRPAHGGPMRPDHPTHLPRHHPLEGAAGARRAQPHMRVHRPRRRHPPTTATLVERAVGLTLASRLLGHANEQITRASYVVSAVEVAPITMTILDDILGFGGDECSCEMSAGADASAAYTWQISTIAAPGRFPTRGVFGSGEVGGDGVPVVLEDDARARRRHTHARREVIHHEATQRG